MTPNTFGLEFPTPTGYLCRCGTCGQSFIYPYKQAATCSACADAYALKATRSELDSVKAQLGDARDKIAHLQGIIHRIVSTCEGVPL